MRARTTSAAFGWATLLGCVSLLCGCGEDRFGATLAARPAPQPIRRADGGTLRLPADRPFSIALPQSSRQPGLEGTAKSEADASKKGTAEARVEVTDSGQATAMFQLGHAFANESGQPAELQFDVRLHHAYDASATPKTGLPDAKVGIKLYARDNEGRLLRDITFLNHSTENGPAQGEADDTTRFTLTLGPNESVDVYIAGQAVIDIKERRSAHCCVTVDKLEFDVTTCAAQSAPAQPPAGGGEKP
jgi:hypothetical protein